MKSFLTTIMFIFITLGYAQQNGSIVGKITDKEMNDDPLPYASVQIKGTSKGTTTDMDGLFQLPEVAPGTYTIVISFIGYSTLEVPNVKVEAGKVANVNATLSADSQQLGEVVITTTARRDSEVALLLEQKDATIIKQEIGAQELSRKGVSDAAAAVTKVTGVSKQEGNSGIFVRGLGDRYNSTTLNGLPLPSNEPENKNIALDLFSTDVIQSVGISKAYDPTLYGDMGGANVEIVSKRHAGAPMLQVNIGSGVNTNAIDQDFKVADGRQVSGFYSVNPPTSTTEYQFTSKFTPSTVSTPINGSFGIKAGKIFKINDESNVNVFVTGSFANGYKYKNGFKRIVGISNDIIPTNFFNVEKFEYGTKTTLLGNVSYKINNKSTLYFNSIFVNSSNSGVNEYDSYVGQGDDRYEFTRQTLTQQNKLFVNQLLGDHTINERLSFNWGASYNTVNADMPDRITNNLILTNDTYSYNTGAPTTNNRYFQYIDEKEIAGKALFSYKLFKHDDSYNGKLTFGYNTRIKSRDFEATQLNFRITGSNIPVTPNTIDDFINADNLSGTSGVQNTFYITTGRLTSLIPFTYSGDLTVHAGLINFEHTASEKVTYTLGVRFEKLLQELTWDTNIQLPSVNFDDAKIDKLYILPSATLKYALNEKQNFRVAASKTYTIPQFKESAPFRYEGIGENSIGNPFLKPSDNYNLDLKWELFPSNTELFSITGFAKYINNPISKVLLNSVLNDNTFVNAGDYAYVFGGEVEFRKNIWQNNADAPTSSLTGGLNFTVMYSEQKLDAQKVADDSRNTVSVNFNEEKDQLQGASPLLVNADITYKNDEGNFHPTLSLVGNYFHDRIYSLGSFGRGNIVEKGIPTLNFISSAEMGDHFEVSVKVQNILNSKIRRVQQNAEGDIDTYNFRAGLNFSLGIKYNIF